MMPMGLSCCIAAGLLAASCFPAGRAVPRGSAGTPRNTSAIIYIIRHGEKLTMLGCLNAAGHSRARYLVDVFNTTPSADHELFYRPTAIFANYYDDGIDCERCNQTEAPLAAALGLPVDLTHGYDPWLGGNSGAAAAMLDAIRRGRAQAGAHGDGGGVECLAKLNALCPHQQWHGPDCIAQCAAATRLQLPVMQALEAAGCAGADLTTYCSSGSVPGAVVVLAAWEHINIQYLAEDLGVSRHLIPTWPGSNYDSVYVLQINTADMSLISFHTAAENFHSPPPTRFATRPGPLRLAGSKIEKEPPQPPPFEGRRVQIQRLKTDDIATRPGSYTGVPCIEWQQLLSHNVRI